jgi:ribosome-binding ATPase YchF (GTP1/OBG family)
LDKNQRNFASGKSARIIVPSGPDEEALMESFSLIAKPVLYVCNVDENLSS